MTSNMKKQAVFVSYHKPNREIDGGAYKYEYDDMVLIKERTEHPDGGYTKRIRMIENFERPFWITKKNARKHKDKREWESLENLMVFKSPQHSLSLNVQKALKAHNPNPATPIRIVNRSPYVYGTDMSLPYFVKEAYRHKYDGARLGFMEVAWMDIETDVLSNEEDKILLISLVFGKWACVYVLEEFINQTTTDWYNEFFRILDEDLPIIRIENKYEVELRAYKTEMELIEAFFKDAHRLKPDYMSGWNNLDFDQKVIAKRIRHHGYDPAEFFSAPEVPRKYKNYRYVPGKAVAESDSDKKTNLRPIERWHEVIAPASFQWVDAMCCFYQNRKHEGMWPSYKLDYVLNKMIKMGKYEIEEAASKKGLAKHAFMQKHYPIHYALYNLFDSIGLDLMDIKTGDLRNKFDITLGDSEYRKMQSNPGKLNDAFMTYLRRERGCILGSTSDQMFNEFDSRLPPLDGWIVALPTIMLDVSNGLRVIKESEDILSKFRNHSGDSDIISSYPLTGVFDNISKMTTEIEVVGIDGLSLDERRRFGLNLMAGVSNSFDNASIGFGLPEFDKLDELFGKHYVDYLQSSSQR